MRRSELAAADIPGATSRPRLAELPPPSDTDHLPPGLAVRSIADAKDRLVTVNSALPKASALDPQPVLGRVGVVSGRLYGVLMIA